MDHSDQYTINWNLTDRECRDTRPRVSGGFATQNHIAALRQSSKGERLFVKAGFVRGLSPRWSDVISYNEITGHPGRGVPTRLALSCAAEQPCFSVLRILELYDKII